MRQEVLFRDRNFLYSGDNLDILRYRIASESVDLVYLDPPFNSNQDYNILFKERTGERTTAQMKAFGDTWRWDRAAADSYRDAIENAPDRVANAMQAFRTLLGPTDMLAYLSMMAPRLVELQRVLKESGSLYLHCDPTASHYLKLLVDAIFGAENFRNEIIWKRTSAHSSAKKYGPIHDVLLYYVNSPSRVWNEPRAEYTDAYLNKYYKYDDGDGRLYWRADITGAGTREGESGKPWRGFDPTNIGRHWAATHAELDQWDAENRVYFPKGGGMPQYKRYRDDSKVERSETFGMTSIGSTQSATSGWAIRRRNRLRC